MSDRPMTSKMKRFVQEYCVDFNGAAAARRAGYAEKWADRQAHQLLEDSRVSAAIEARIEELAMEAGEVLLRLSDQGRNLQMRFLQPNGTIDLEALIDAGLAHLVKGTKFDKDGRLQVEFYDAQRAQIELAKIRGLTGPKGTEEDPIHYKTMEWTAEPRSE